MSRNTASIYNGISILFVVLSLLIIVIVAAQLVSPPPQDPRTVAGFPTPFELPTLTPSFTPTITPSPTVTSSPTNTETPTLTPTATFTVPPSPTLTNTPGPTLTPSDTPTPSASPTELPTNTPTGPTATFTPTDSPYFFQLRDEVFLGPNTVNSAGCAWQGVGGSVLGMDGVETTRQYQVRVFNGGIERVTTTGSNSLYGQFSGWEIPLDNTINNRTYFVRLESAAGIQLAPDVQVSFPGDCNANSAIVRFIQIRDFSPPPS
jgi:hypothetical protein